LRDAENIALDPSQSTTDLIESYFKREVQPHVPDAWINADKRDAQDADCITQVTILYKLNHFTFVVKLTIKRIFFRFNDFTNYFKREVQPHVPDAWINADKRDAQDAEIGIVGYDPSPHQSPPNHAVAHTHKNDG
jgi:hypothetical protein